MFFAVDPAVSVSAFGKHQGMMAKRGGILAWDGHLLPATPNLKVFDLAGTDREVLLRAMDLERGAERFYTALRQRYSRVAWANSLATLAGDRVEGGYSCAALVAMLEQQPFEPCRTSLEMALTIECSAYDLSRNMAHRFRGQPLEEVFNAIAEAEKEHMQLAARGLALCDA